MGSCAALDTALLCKFGQASISVKLRTRLDIHFTMNIEYAR